MSVPLALHQNIAGTMIFNYIQYVQSWFHFVMDPACHMTIFPWWYIHDIYSCHGNCHLLCKWYSCSVVTIATFKCNVLTIMIVDGVCNVLWSTSILMMIQSCHLMKYSNKYKGLIYHWRPRNGFVRWWILIEHMSTYDSHNMS